MDPGAKLGVFFGAGLLLLGGGWAMFRWVLSLIEDSTTSEGEEADDPAEPAKQEGPWSGFDD